MSVGLRLLLPFARAYLEHVGVRLAAYELRLELERRLGLLPSWARLAAGLGGLYARRVGPWLELRTLRPFERLDAPERERVLRRLLGTRSPAARGLYLAARSVVAGTAWGRPRAWEALGYRMES